MPRSIISIARAAHALLIGCRAVYGRYPVPVTVECVPTKHYTAAQPPVRFADPHNRAHNNPRICRWRRTAQTQLQPDILRKFYGSEPRQPRQSVRFSRENLHVDASSISLSCTRRALACAAHLHCICLSPATACSRRELSRKTMGASGLSHRAAQLLVRSG